MTEERIVRLSNKSRKGIYRYTRKNEKSHYYKIKEKELREIPIGTEIKSSKRKSKPTKKEEKRKEKRKQKREKINEQLKAGIITTKQRKAEMDKRQIQEMKEELIRPLIRKKKLLKQMTTEHNMKKIQERIEYTITVSDEQGILATLTKTSITPEKAIKEANELKEGNIIDESSGTRTMRELGWQSNLIRAGTIRSVKIKATIRKQK